MVTNPDLPMGSDRRRHILVRRLHRQTQSPFKLRFFVTAAISSAATVEPQWCGDAALLLPPWIGAVFKGACASQKDV